MPDAVSRDASIELGKKYVLNKRELAVLRSTPGSPSLRRSRGRYSPHGWSMRVARESLPGTPGVAPRPNANISTRLQAARSHAFEARRLPQPIPPVRPGEFSGSSRRIVFQRQRAAVRFVFAGVSMRGPCAETPSGSPPGTASRRHEGTVAASGSRLAGTRCARKAAGQSLLERATD